VRVAFRKSKHAHSASNSLRVLGFIRPSYSFLRLESLAEVFTVT
jgi:hypothetical protein